MELNNLFPDLGHLTTYIESATSSPKEKQLGRINLALVALLKGLFLSLSQCKDQVTLQANKFSSLSPKMATYIESTRKRKQALSLNESLVENSEEIESEMFATVYDPQIAINKKFQQELETQAAELASLKKKLTANIKTSTDIITENEKAIKKLIDKLDKCKKLLKESEMRDRVLKKLVVNKCLNIHITSLDTYSYKQKYRDMLKKVMAETNELRRSFIFTDEPMSNDELKAFKEALIGTLAKNTINELSIENAYISEGLWLSEIIASNAMTIRRIVINKTLLDITGAMKILTAIKNTKAKLNELNLDENKLQGNDLSLLANLFNGANIRRFSVRKNPFDLHSIEKFMKTTKDYIHLEEIDVGDIEISERKELEWRTNYISLTFNKIYDC